MTGSGKTAVYLEAISKVIDNGKQVCLLQIALTGDFTKRIKARFGNHRRNGILVFSIRAPQGLENGWSSQAQIVIELGQLFLPFEELGLIVVDEEYDSSYKQQDGVLYHARDMAVLRASLAGASNIGINIPSLETWNNAK